MTKNIHIVFDGPPDINPPRFIEVEDDDGKSISVGEWNKRPDGYYELTIPSHIALQAFKDFVHGRLDEAGVPVDPPGPHKDAGCRVGQRLDTVFDHRNALISAALTITHVVDQIETRCMAADGPVTPTLREATEKELREIWKAADKIRKSVKP